MSRTFSLRCCVLIAVVVIGARNLLVRFMLSTRLGLTRANLCTFAQVLEFLCSPDDDSRHSERQQVTAFQGTFL